MVSIVHQSLMFSDGVVGAAAIPLIGARGSIPVSMFIVQSDNANAAGSYIAISNDPTITIGPASRGLQMAVGRGIVFSAVEEQIENALVGILQCERMRPRIALDLMDYYIVGSAAGLLYHVAYMVYDTQ